MRLAFAILLLSACTSTSPESAADACQQVAVARCDRLASCSMADLERRWPDAATCVAREAAACVTAQAAPQTAATPASVVACATALDSSTCDSMFAVAPPAACLPQTGPLADGAACSYPAQCASAYCTAGNTTLCGTCAAAPVAGASCATSGCGPTMSCVKATMQCQAPVAVGGACSKASPCEETLACVGATQTTTGTCMAEVATAGAACDPARKTGPDCSNTAGLACDTATKLCVALPLVAAGQPCGLVGTVETRCLAGATCVIATGATIGTCVAPAADGAACDDTVGPECLAPARCVSGTCQLPGSQICS